ncbi:Negative regulator of beta-lactamase expression [Yersinia frederiksenii]|uniref:N-acetylmuramoyl-L-alanine amidase n=2 Tax=Yersinia frederiksenii TaxID=29484 RepID=A0A380PQC0_YERFR|nr:N-acetylmuramoyl-L-alanine amidase [Yersinia frederiksenii]ATM95883.1 N-acetylmuramoyl-L-alanine amidase [Yersinia frederiksenii]EEQ13232.1 Negative regulator of beta-lactamase expression [Yersinia frederiksenii ATCC 33641]KGA44510.1 N-acetylmuramoyl-L-alanine amidase family protein [Yersinia frederiksenii ATCC 33641]SUP75462.1 Negative regulator of beta-lactamase expression [Yersinia frederiksenii]
MYQIDYNSYRSVKGFNFRVRFLVLHYTSENFADSIASLTGSKVSVQYLVPDKTDESYIQAGFKDMRIFNLVDEQARAWHAGESGWAGRTQINDSSIGIEIVNLATESEGIFNFPPYPAEQIVAVKQLASNILQRYPDITPVNVVAHSDIAPTRKSDPGPAFPWQELYEAGIGAWYDNDTKQKYAQHFVSHGLPTRAELLSRFSIYGYDITCANSDDGYHYLVRAFQLHFRPENYSGSIDIETAAILYALVEKYFHSI